MATADRRYAQAIRQSAAKARSRTSLEASSELTRLVDGKRRLVSDPPLIVPIDELVGKADARKHEQRMGDLMEAYQESLDPAVAAWSPGFATQVKEAMPSVLENYLGSSVYTTPQSGWSKVSD